MFTNPVCTYVKNGILFFKILFSYYYVHSKMYFCKMNNFLAMTSTIFFKLTFKHLQLAQPLGLVVNGMSTLLPHEQFKYSRQKDEYLAE